MSANLKLALEQDEREKSYHNIPKQQVLTEAELAEAIGVSKWTARTWRLQGGMPYFQVGHRIFYRLPSVLKWMDKRECGQDSGPVAYGTLRRVD